MKPRESLLSIAALLLCAFGFVLPVAAQDDAPLSLFDCQVTVVVPEGYDSAIVREYPTAHSGILGYARNGVTFPFAGTAEDEYDTYTRWVRVSFNDGRNSVGYIYALNVTGEEDCQQQYEQQVGHPIILPIGEPFRLMGEYVTVEVSYHLDGTFNELHSDTLLDWIANGPDVVVYYFHNTYAYGVCLQVENNLPQLTLKHWPEPCSDVDLTTNRIAPFVPPQSPQELENQLIAGDGTVELNGYKYQFDYDQCVSGLDIRYDYNTSWNVEKSTCDNERYAAGIFYVADLFSQLSPFDSAYMYGVATDFAVVGPLWQGDIGVFFPGFAGYIHVHGNGFTFTYNFNQVNVNGYFPFAALDLFQLSPIAELMEVLL